MLENLKTINQIEFDKILRILSSVENNKNIDNIKFSLTSKYHSQKDEYVVKTSKIFEDLYIKIKVNYCV